jgi:hypothetical protein
MTDLIDVASEMTETIVLLKGKLDEAQARLRDIAMGAEGMLHPALGVTGAMRGYIEEVKRVAGAPL